MIPELAELGLPDTVPDTVVRAFAGATPLFTRAQVEHAVDQLAVRVTLELQDQDPILITVMQGGLVFMGKLMQRLVFPLQQGYVDVASYGDARRGGELRWQGQSCPAFVDRTVLFVDDVLDRGQTLAALVDWARDRGAARVLTAVLVAKPSSLRVRPLVPDFVALDAPDRFLIGCGMDLAGYGRNLPAIYALEDGEDQA